MYVYIYIYIYIYITHTHTYLAPATPPALRQIAPSFSISALENTRVHAQTHQAAIEAEQFVRGTQQAFGARGRSVLRACA